MNMYEPDIKVISGNLFGEQHFLYYLYEKQKINSE